MPNSHDGNIQIVSRFVNFWKCAQENGMFLELLERVVTNRLKLGTNSLRPVLRTTYDWTSVLSR